MRHVSNITDKMSVETLRTRFLGVIKGTLIDSVKILLIGAGGIGNPMAKMLASVGFVNVTIMDGDIVEQHNVLPQGYKLGDIGRSKAEALVDEVFLSTGNRYTPLHEMYDEKTDTSVYDIIISAVDNQKTRIILADRIQAPLLIDARMVLGKFHVYIIDFREGVNRKDYFDIALFSDDKAIQLACTEKAISFTGSTLASYVGSWLIKYNNDPETTLKELTRTGDGPYMSFFAFNVLEFKEI